MNYYRNIDREKIQFHFICDEDSTDIPYKEIESLGGKVILVPPYQKLFEYNKELTKIFKENNYKIVHSHINTLSVFPLRIAKKCGIPIRIAHSHSTSNKKEWKKNLLKQILRPFSKVYANRYMCCSEYAGRWLFGNKAYNEGKVYLLNNAIDVDKFKYNKKIRKQKRKELDIDDDILVIGHVGRFVEQKNHTFLIDIFNEFHKENEKSMLLLIGQGPLMEDIKEKVNSLGLTDFVEFLGQRNDVNELYQAMDLFLLPSLYEGLGMVMIEAECSDLPCVASTKVPQITKINDNVYFIDLEETSEHWADNIKKLISSNVREDKTKEISDAGFNINEEAQKLLSLYKDMWRKSQNGK